MMQRADAGAVQTRVRRSPRGAACAAALLAWRARQSCAAAPPPAPPGSHAATACMQRPHAIALILPSAKSGAKHLQPYWQAREHDLHLRRCSSAWLILTGLGRAVMALASSPVQSPAVLTAPAGSSTVPGLTSQNERIPISMSPLAAWTTPGASAPFCINAL